MITIGGRTLFYTGTFLIGDNQDARIDVPTAQQPMPFVIRFVPSTTGEQKAGWRTHEGRVLMEFTGWNNPLGTVVVAPTLIGELDGQPLSFQLSNRHINGMNLVHFFLYRGGANE